jgi:hypothetical protein
VICLDCRNRRRFARGTGLHAPWLLLCYHCYLRRRALWHIAGRLSILLVSAAFAIALVAVAAGWLP